MSGHTNRNRRNGGNPRSRHGAHRQRGADNRATQQKNGSPPSPPQESTGSGQPSDSETSQPPRASQPPEAAPPHAEQSGPKQREPHGEPETSHKPMTSPEQPDAANPRGKTPFAAASRGGHAYIPASGPRPGMNGHVGQNGHNSHSSHNSHNGHSSQRGVNGYPYVEPQADPTMMAGDSDDTDGDRGSTPDTWRAERLNGGTDTTPREPFRPESRGEVGPLIDSLHTLFAQDRAAASRGDAIRCGICYLHFPLGELEYREAEGFYVCASCGRALGHHPLMMIRRQQAPHGG